jgi:enoyl-CoA hydratase/carnithine racemase
MRIAADNSRFSIPELDAGIPLSWGGMAQVVRLLGETMANDLVLTCRPFDADDALRAGFISRIVATDGFDEGNLRTFGPALSMHGMTPTK